MTAPLTLEVRAQPVVIRPIGGEDGVHARGDIMSTSDPGVADSLVPLQKTLGPSSKFRRNTE